MGDAPALMMESKVTPFWPAAMMGRLRREIDQVEVVEILERRGNGRGRGRKKERWEERKEERSAEIKNAEEFGDHLLPPTLRRLCLL